MKIGCLSSHVAYLTLVSKETTRLIIGYEKFQNLLSNYSLKFQVVRAKERIDQEVLGNDSETSRTESKAEKNS